MPLPRFAVALIALSSLAPWQVFAALPTSGARVMQIVLRISGDDVRVAGLRLLPAETRPTRGRRTARDLVVSLESAEGERLATATADDPTRLRAEWSPDGRRLVRDDVRLESGEVAVKFPYDPRAVALRVSRTALDDGEAKRKDPVWAVPLRDVRVLELGTLPTADEYAKLADFDVRTIVSSGPSENRLDVVFLGDGYRASELGKYHDDVRRVADYMLGIGPYSGLRDMVNVHAVDVISNESGIDDPAFGIRRDTALDLSFNIGNVQRCVYTTSPSKVYAAAANAPSYDYIFVMANDSQYGGCGGSFACFTTHETATEIAVHEFGHSFGLLADEYGSGDGGGQPPPAEPLDPNATRASSRQALVQVGKWDYWIPDGQRIPTPPGTGGVGLFEGAVYTDRGAYRPQDTCKMRELNVDFCRVCVEQHVLRLHAFADPIDVFGPAPEDVVGGGRLLASATDPAGDAMGSADIVGVSLYQRAGTIETTIELAGPPPQPSNVGGYSVALTAPGAPLRYVRVWLDRRASFTDEDFQEIASLGGAYVSGTTIRAAVPLELLGNPSSLTWSARSSVGIGSDSVAGSTVSVARIGNAFVPLAPSESLTLHAGLIPSASVEYATRWTVDGAPKGEGASLTLTGAELGTGRHLVAFVTTGTTSEVRRDLDGVLASRREVVVVVGDVTGRPTAEAGPNVSAARGASVTLDGASSSGSDLAYTWRQIAGPAVSLDDPHSDRPAFVAPSRNIVLAFQLVVASGDRIGLPDPVYVTVGDAPVVTRVTVKNGRKLVVDGSGFAAGSVVEVDGASVTDTKAPRAGTRLTSRRALDLIPAGREVAITVRAPDGFRSAPFAFVR